MLFMRITYRNTLPILPTSFKGVDDYIHHYAAFVLQEVQAQALKGINRYSLSIIFPFSKSRLRCSIVQCTYDGSENACTLYLGEQSVRQSWIDTHEKLSPLINTYSIIVPYSITNDDEDRKELGLEGGQPKFFLPFFYGVLNTQVLVYTRFHTSREAMFPLFVPLSTSFPFSLPSLTSSPNSKPPLPCMSSRTPSPLACVRCTPLCNSALPFVSGPAFFSFTTVCMIQRNLMLNNSQGLPSQCLPSTPTPSSFYNLSRKPSALIPILVLLGPMWTMPFRRLSFLLLFRPFVFH